MVVFQLTMPLSAEIIFFCISGEIQKNNIKFLFCILNIYFATYVMNYLAIIFLLQSMILLQMIVIKETHLKVRLRTAEKY